MSKEKKTMRIKLIKLSITNLILDLYSLYKINLYPHLEYRISIAYLNNNSKKMSNITANKSGLSNLIAKEI